MNAAAAIGHSPAAKGEFPQVDQSVVAMTVAVYDCSFRLDCRKTLVLQSVSEPAERCGPRKPERRSPPDLQAHFNQRIMEFWKRQIVFNDLLRIDANAGCDFIDNFLRGMGRGRV